MSTDELESRLIYSIFVAGKSAKFVEKVMDKFDAHRQRVSPLTFVRILVDEDNLKWVLYDIRSGNYNRIERALRELAAATIDLRTCTPAELEAIHGIGPKTSRFFIIWTRPGERHAALDVHILRWLRTLGHDAPKSTPTGEKYAALEKIFLAEADKRGMTPRELDSQIWDAGSGYNAGGGGRQSAA